MRIRSRLALSLAGALVLGAQTFQVDSHLVLVPVTVTDHHGANVRGLTKDRFTLYDDRLPRPIDAFYSEDAPCAVGLVADASGSVRSRWNWERAAIHALVEAANPEDEFFATVVSSAPAVVSLGAADPESIDARLGAVAPGGWTALFDGVRLAASELRRSRRPCRALVVVSDGLDNHSRATKAEVESFLMEADIQVYAIAIAPPAAGRKAIQISEDQRGIRFLNDLAEKTGGVGVLTADTEDPRSAARKIGEAMRNRYVLGFRHAENADAGKWHTIRVKIDRSKVNVYSRSGYRLPAGS